jgi:hypothetical protein
LRGLEQQDAANGEREPKGAKEVKRLLIAVALFLCVAVVGRAQTQHVVISVNASGYNGAKGTQAVSLAGAAFQVTKNVSAGYFQISNPADSTAPKYHMGSLQYTRELQALLGKKLSSKFVFDTTNWLVTFQAGAGKVSYDGANRVAEVAGIFISRPVANNLQLNCGYQFLHGQGNSILTRNNTSAPTVGLTFTF